MKMQFSDEVLYRVTVPPGKHGAGYCAGVWHNARLDRIYEAAPILRWTLNHDLARLVKWVKERGGTMERVDV